MLNKTVPASEISIDSCIVFIEFNINSSVKYKFSSETFDNVTFVSEPMSKEWLKALFICKDYVSCIFIESIIFLLK